MSSNISHSGIKVMEYFFSRLQTRKMLRRDKYNNPTIDLSWFNSKDISIDVIEETVVRLLSRNTEYVSRSRSKGNDPNKVSRISIEKLEGNFSVKFVGADNWTALQVVEDAQKIIKRRVPTVSFIRFQDEIIKTILSKENPDYSPFKAGIGPSLDEGCKNLVNKYKSLMDGIKRESKPPKQNPGIKSMRDYFAKDLAPEKMFTRDRFNNPIVPLSRFDTKDLPESIIQKTIARLMSESNDKYEEKVALRGKKPTDISSVEIHVHDNEFSARFIGADDWTLIQVVEDPSAQSERPIPTISFDQLQDEIIKTILTNKDQTQEYSSFATLRKGIGPCINKACQNMVTYYKAKYNAQKTNEQKEQQEALLENPSESNQSILLFSGIVDLPEYPGTPRPNNPDNESHSSQGKKAEDIPIEDRLAFLNDSQPFAKGLISRRKENGTIDPKAFHAYVYTKDLLKDLPDAETPHGFLFICEPDRGDMETRVFFVSQNEYDESVFSHSEISEQALLMTYVQEQLEKTSRDFSSDGGVLLRHRALEDYTARLAFYISGNVPETVRCSRVSYSTKLQRLYDNPALNIPLLRYSSKDVGKLGLFNNTSGLSDRTAEQEIGRLNKNPNKSQHDL